MRFKPHPYQHKAINWVKSHPRSALFLDMGLGKTVSTLTAIIELMDEAEIETTLVVAPKTVAEATWSAESKKWDHLKSLRVVKVMGNEKQRLEALATDADVYVIGRDSLAWLFDHWKGRFPFSALVLDELTSFKSRTAKRYKAAMKLSRQARYVVGLTGTPAPNGLLDLWAQMKCIDGGKRLGPFIGKFRDTYFHAVNLGNFTKYSLRSGAEQTILGKISDICLTMQAKDYLSLPDLATITEEIEMPGALMKQYKQFERDQITLIGDDVEAITASSAAALMIKLSQFASGNIYDEDRMVHHIHDLKVDRLAEIVEQAQSQVLVFYQYKHEVNPIRAALKGYRVRTYEGEEDLKAWNNHEIDVLLAHPASTAYGLNMQEGGHYIVWYETGWNLEQYQQANARLHRQGQTHPVTAYRLVCKGTVDELMCKAIDRKSGEQQTAIDLLKALIKKSK